MKYWLNEEKRKKFVDDHWLFYKETNNPDYLAQMLAVGGIQRKWYPR